MELLWNQRELKTELSRPAGCCGLSFPTITRRNWRWLPKVALHIFKFTYCCRNASTKLTIPRTQKLVTKLVMATQDQTHYHKKLVMFPGTQPKKKPSVKRAFLS